MTQDSSALKLKGKLLSQDAISDWEFARFRQLIFDMAGITLSDHKKHLVVSRLSCRLRHYCLDSFADYYRLLTQDPPEGELQIVIDQLTTNETHFFREPKHFGFIKRYLLDSGAFQSPLRCWSAVCSTGEEPYSLAMLLAGHYGYQADWTVLASDINAQVLAGAREAIYPSSRQAEIPTRYLHQYCLKGVRSRQGSFLINKRLREHVQFRQINLNTTLPDVGSFDLILLRNVLIYFSADTKREVVLRVVSRLRPGGYLLVGHSETVSGISEQLHQVSPSIYQKR